DSVEADSGVTLMTMHASKGLEFKVIFVVGLEEGIFPSQRVMFDEDELEEERRLMYVALTRAEDQLFLSRADSRMIYGKMESNVESRFLKEIPSELIDGEVVEIDSRKAQNPFVKKSSRPHRRTPAVLTDNSGETMKAGDQAAHKRIDDGIISNTTGEGDSPDPHMIFTREEPNPLLANFALLDIKE